MLEPLLTEEELKQVRSDYVEFEWYLTHSLDEYIARVLREKKNE